MKIGINAENFLRKLAQEHSEHLVESIEKVLENENLSTDEKIKFIQSKSLDYTFFAISETIKENNKTIERQLRRAGINLP